MKTTKLPILFLFLASISFAVETPHLNETLPDFTLEDTEGKIHSLSDYRGKVVVLVTFGYNCGFCKQRARVLETIHEEFGGDDLAVIGLDGWDGSKDQVIEFGESSDVTYLLLTGAGTYIDGLNTIDDRGSIFILNGEGVVVSSCDDGFQSLACFEMQELESQVEEALAETSIALPFQNGSLLKRHNKRNAEATAFDATGRRVKMHESLSYFRNFTPYLFYLE